MLLLSARCNGFRRHHNHVPGRKKVRDDICGRDQHSHQKLKRAPFLQHASFLCMWVHSVFIRVRFTIEYVEIVNCSKEELEMTLIGHLVIVAFIGLNVLTLTLSTHHEKDTVDRVAPEARQKAASEYEALKAKLSENYHRAAAKFDEIVGDEDAKRLHEEALLKARDSLGGQQINQQMGQASDSVHEAGSTFVDKIKQWAGMKEQSASENAKETEQNAADRLKEETDSADHGAKSVYEKIKEWSGVAGDKATELKDKAASQANEMGNFAQGQFERGRESLDATRGQASQLYDEAKSQASSTVDQAKARASQNYQAAMDKTGEAVDRGRETSQTLLDATKQRASDAYETARDTIQSTIDATKQRANENYGAAKDAVQGTIDATKQRASDAYHTVGDTVGKVYDSTAQNLENAQERVGEMYEATKDVAGETQQRVGSAYVAAKDKLQGK